MGHRQLSETRLGPDRPVRPSDTLFSLLRENGFFAGWSLSGLQTRKPESIIMLVINTLH